jgi:hypothetical protein
VEKYYKREGIVVYTTSMRTIRQTYHACEKVRATGASSARACRATPAVEETRPLTGYASPRVWFRAADGKQLFRAAAGKQLFRAADGKQLFRAADGKQLFRAADGKQLFRAADGKQLFRAADGKQLFRAADGKQLCCRV